MAENTVPARNYPMPAPEHDPRFTLGLTLDVKAVLIAHGYPDFAGAGLDYVALRQALFRFIYDTTDPADTDHTPLTGEEC